MGSADGASVAQAPTVLQLLVNDMVTHPDIISILPLVLRRAWETENGFVGDLHVGDLRSADYVTQAHVS